MDLSTLKLKVELGPLRDWWSKSDKALEACWTPNQPKLGDHTLRSYLMGEGWKEAWR